MIFEWDDFGANHVISDQCQSHDCRDQLDKLHVLNPAFKCTLFAIPGEMTQELLNWCKANESWIELCVHGFCHSSNYECEKMSYQEFDHLMSPSAGFGDMINRYFEKIFRAPGWQISDDIYRWLERHNWIVADQEYNTERRERIAPNLRAYINNNGQFHVYSVENGPEPAYHGHTWDVGWNGIYEDYEKVADLVKNATEFKFVSELFDA
mgnify:CR=1 FL=1